jgi:hypothetical protein
MAFALKNSTTILLPQWYNTLAAHHLPHHMMPHDISTQWNSTFDMLNFALKYCPAINTMTATQDFDLHKYELVSGEWKIAGELCDVLQVCFFPLIFAHTSLLYRFSRMLHSSSHEGPQASQL